MNLSPEESSYFEALVAYTQARTGTQRSALGSILLKAHSERFKQTEVVTHRSTPNALVPVLLTMLTFNDLEKMPSALADLLAVDIQTVKDALSLLVADGVINYSDLDDTYDFKEKTFRISDSAHLRNFYDYWIERSRLALDLPRSERNYKSLKFALSEAEYEQALEKIQNYALLLLSQFKSDELNGRRLYMYESCLFPVTSRFEQSPARALACS